MGGTGSLSKGERAQVKGESEKVKGKTEISRLEVLF